MTTALNPFALSQSKGPSTGSGRTVGTRPRIGFLGLGWIGLHRLRAVVDQNICDVVAVADPDPQARATAQEIAGASTSVSSLEELLTLELDGAVIATPSALHATQ